VDATWIVAVVGLATTLGAALIAPLIQGRVAAKNATAKRLEEQQEATYVDAIVYAQSIEKRLSNLLEDPLLQSGQPLLVAPSAVARTFSELALAWEILCLNLNEEGADEMIGSTPIFSAKRDDKDVVRVASALKELKSVIRPKALGALD
jgi:hypothetical protein